MAQVKGLRSRTRHKFRKPFRRNGAIRMKNYLQKHKVGDFVDIIVDGAIHGGMPYQFYHGRTGRIFNVNKKSVGVAVHKQVKQRKIEKRLHVRVEHIRKSCTRDDFLRRIQENDAKKTEANKNGQRISTKRQPAGPRTAHNVKINVDNMVGRGFQPHREIH